VTSVAPVLPQQPRTIEQPESAGPSGRARQDEEGVGEVVQGSAGDDERVEDLVVPDEVGTLARDRAGAA
jgi:hypothetical protein